MTNPRFLVIQIISGLHPRDATVKANTLTGKGVLVSAMTDGFYTDRADAEALAADLAEEHPALDTYVLEVVQKVTPHA